MFVLTKFNNTRFEFIFTNLVSYETLYNLNNINFNGASMADLWTQVRCTYTKPKVRVDKSINDIMQLIL